MKPVTRLFLITTGWTLAFYMASSFMSAWFWHIGSGFLPIVRFYIVLFITMTVTFAVAAVWLRPPRSVVFMTIGIFFNAVFLAALLWLGPRARDLLPELAILEGLSSGCYWLAWFTLSAQWVTPDDSHWYNSWTGSLEALLGLIVPPASGWVITRLPGAAGYRLVFLVGLASLAANLLIIGPAWATTPLASRPVHPQPLRIPGWRPLLLSFVSLGLRDGLYFFLPPLLLFIVSHSAELLGIYTAMQATIQGLVFTWLGRTPRIRPLIYAVALSGLAFGLFWLPLTPGVLLGLGGLVALAYPSFKVALESQALQWITQFGTDLSHQARLTAIKEVAINSGRLVGLLVVMLLIITHPRLHPNQLGPLLAVWAITPVAIWWWHQKSVQEHDAGSSLPQQSSQL